ncbi:MAG TPA: TldD/PmbA family protein [Dongiaceae bacterium]|nr:TldD/PmbA family protein [Dongiaceae bacterium]
MRQFDQAHLRRAAGALAAAPGDYADLFLEHATQAEIRRDRDGERQVLLGRSSGAATRVLSAGGTRHQAAGGLPDGEADMAPSAAERSAAVRALAAYLDALEIAIGAGPLRGVGDAGVRLRAEARSQAVTIVNSEGEIASDRRDWVSFSVRLTRPARAGAGGGRTTRATPAMRMALAGGGARDAERLAVVHPPAEVAARLERALEEADATAPAPTGEVPVILGPGVGGLLIHEACGHALEGDRALRGRSVFANLLGETVGAANLTIVDDPTLDGLAGSRRVDDEGWPVGPTVLIDAGRVAGLLLDRATARRAGTTPTGSARRESYRDLPLPRMTNTFVRAGNVAPEEILAGVTRGLYVAELGAGRVDTTSGEFSFRVRRGYLVAGGRKVSPAGPCVIAGNGVRALGGIVAIGNDLTFDPGTGECGKDGQRARAAVGQPTLRVEGLTVQPEGA